MKMIGDRCHACQKDNAYKEFYWTWGDGKLVEDTYRCQYCEHVFRQYEGDVEEYHREKYRQVGEEGHELYSEEERSRYIREFLAYAESYLHEEQSVLEIGSGDGMFAKEAQKYVKSVICSEIDAKMAKMCINLGFETINKSILDFENEKYDVVVGMDVLEHILDIEEFKIKMEQIVKEYMIFQVPIYRTMVPPNPTFDGHSHYFSPKSIAKLFEEKFESESIHIVDRNTLARGPEMFCVLKRK